jgi:ketosteroid isomerase-like protein
MRKVSVLWLSLMFAGAWMNATGAPPSVTDQVMEAERAFARTMADRNLEAFTGFLSEEAIFFGGEAALRGKQQVAEGWAPYFEGEAPPFSWEPDQVEVLESGELALSTGPVRNPEGNIVGRFNSIWRLEAPGTWRIVFDKGSQVCSKTDD